MKYAICDAIRSCVCVVSLRRCSGLLFMSQMLYMFVYCYCFIRLIIFLCFSTFPHRRIAHRRFGTGLRHTRYSSLTRQQRSNLPPPSRSLTRTCLGMRNLELSRGLRKFSNRAFAQELRARELEARLRDSDRDKTGLDTSVKTLKNQLLMVEKESRLQERFDQTRIGERENRLEVGAVRGCGYLQAIKLWDCRG